MDRLKTIKQFIWNLVFWIAFVVAVYLSYKVYFVDTLSTKSKWIGLFSGSIAILLATVKYIKNVYTYAKDKGLIKTLNTYFSGVDAYFIKTTKLVLFLGLFFSIFTFKIIGAQFAFALIFGLIVSMFLNIANIKGIIGTSIREAAFFENEHSFKRIFNNSTTASLLIYGVILSLSVIFYHMFKDYQLVAGLALGISIGCIIYTCTNTISEKITTTANNLLNESEYRNIEEKKLLTFANDIQKGALCAFSQSNQMMTIFAVVLIVAISVGMYCVEIMGSFLPIVIATNALFSAVFILGIIKTNKKTDYIKLFIKANIAIIILFNIINYYTIKCWLPSYINLIYSIILGCLAGLIYNFNSIKKLLYSDKTAINISNSAVAGIKQIFTQSIKESLLSAIFPFVLAFAVVIFSFITTGGLEEPSVGLWGIILSVLGFICCGIMSLLFINFSQNLVNIDLFSNLFNNELDFELIKETGEKFLSVFKRYTNLAVILCVVSVVIGYSVVAEIEQVDLINPYVISALILGMMIPFCYIVLSINNVFKNSKRAVFEVKQDLKYFAQIQEPFDILSRSTIKKLSENVAVDFVFAIGLILLVYFLIAIFLKTEAIAGFLIGIFVSFAGIAFVIENISIFLNIAKRFLTREYKDTSDSEEFNDLAVLDNVFSFTKDFISPLLNDLVIFLAVLSFAIIPVLNSF